AVQKAMLQAAQVPLPDPALPAVFPLIPLRNAVLAVGAVAPLSIGRPSSIAAVEAAQQVGALVAVFAQKEESRETPVEADVYPVGAVAELRSAIPSGEGTVWIVLRGVKWVRLERFEDRGRYVAAHVAPFVVKEEHGDEVAELVRKLRER